MEENKTQENKEQGTDQVDMLTERVKAQLGSLTFENLHLSTELYKAKENEKRLTEKVVQLTEVVNALKDNKESEKKDEK